MTSFVPATALNDGDSIGIFSPSEWLGNGRPQRVRAECDFLERHGFRTKFAAHYLARDIIRAGTVEERLADINELLDRNDVRALLATWGGKACNQLINELPYEKFARFRKPVIGFSDIVVLLNAITARTGLATFHGPNIVGKLDESDWSNLDCLRPEFPWTETNLLLRAKASEGVVLRQGKATGRLFGGNLNCFVLGVVLSKTDLSFFDGGIFFWEDVGLTPRQIDQFLTALANIGLLNRISGMVIGDFFAEERDEWLRSDPLESAMHAVRNFRFPVVYAPLFGHRKLENPVFPIGATAELDTTEFSLRLTEMPVSR